ncbi:MAG: alpha/beta fold hydrolase [Blastocatellia bacterium]
MNGKRGFQILAGLLLLLILGGGYAWFSRPADVDFEAARGEIPNVNFSRFAEVDGVRVHYQERGSGTPLVLIHGYGASSFTWKDAFAVLSNRYRVIAVDLKGFGFTGKPEGDYTRRAQGELVVGLLDHLKIEKAVLCGNSMGGEVSLNAAVHHPERVAGLILVDSAGVTVGGTGSLSPGYMRAPFIGPLLAAVALTSNSMVRSGLRKSFHNQSLVTEDRIAAYYRPLKTVGGQRAAFLARVQSGADPVEPRLSEIKAPTLILWGAEDRLIPLEAGRKMQTLIPGSRLVVFDQCGHIPQEEMPERFVREVMEFLAGLEQAAVKPGGIE